MNSVFSLSSDNEEGRSAEAMDGSVDGDIAELSYSPIVVSVYFIWVRKMILIQIFSILYIILHLVYDI